MANPSENYMQPSFFDIESTRERLETLETNSTGLLAKIKATPNVLLVRTAIGAWPETKKYLTHPFDVIDPNYQLYAPNNFIFGHYKYMGGKYVFNPGVLSLGVVNILSPDPDGVFYRDSTKDLQEYDRNIRKGKLEIVGARLLSDSELESIARGAEFALMRENRVNRENRVKRFFSLG